MIEKLNTDYFAPQLYLSNTTHPFLTVTTEQVTIEYEDRSVTIRRGIYAFKTEKERKDFTNLVNDAMSDDVIAFSFNVPNLKHGD